MKNRLNRLVIFFMLFVRKMRISTLPNSGENYIFSFKWSTYVKVLTVLVLFFIVLGVVATFNIINNPYYGFCAIVLAITIVGLSLISAPMAIYLGDDEIQLHGVLEDIRIRYTSITKIEPISKKEVRKMFPLMSTLGFFGYFGNYIDFKNRRLVKIMASQFDNLVLIESSKGKIFIISAYNYSRIVNSVNDKILDRKQYVSDMVSILHKTPNSDNNFIGKEEKDLVD